MAKGIRSRIAGPTPIEGTPCSYNIRMAPSHDVLILGGGVIGLTTAYYLAREGVRVRLVERDDIGQQASWAGAGILPPTDIASAHTPIDRLRALSMGLYPELSAQLRKQTGIDNGYRICGGIELPDPQSPSNTLPTEEWHHPGVPFTHWDRDALRKNAPYLADDLDEGVFLPGLAQVRNPWHMRALEEACRRLGVDLQPHCPVQRLIVEGRRVKVETAARTEQADDVLIAAGAWAGLLLSSMGIPLPVRPVRGQMLLYRTDRLGVWPVLLQGMRYLVPRTDGRILVGSTEEEAGFNAHTTPEGERGLEAFAHRILPLLRDVPLERTWAGLRPASADGMPYLGAVPGVDHLHVACGHFRAGLQLSPATGRVMADHLLGRPTTISLEAFRLDRGS